MLVINNRLTQLLYLSLSINDIDIDMTLSVDINYLKSIGNLRYYRLFITTKFRLGIAYNRKKYSPKPYDLKI